MSTFALKRGYELELPTNFVEVDNEEMEYIDGGFDPIEFLLSYAAKAVLEKIIVRVATKAVIIKVAGIVGVSASTIATGSVVLIAAALVGIGYAAVKMIDGYSSGLVDNASLMEFNAHRYCCNSMAIGKH